MSGELLTFAIALFVAGLGLGFLGVRWWFRRRLAPALQAIAVSASPVASDGGLFQVAEQLIERAAELEGGRRKEP